jgi:O-antigen/teichoic acid export membrane protein
MSSNTSLNSKNKSRSLLIQKNRIYLFVSKILILIVGFLIIPISLKVVNKTELGLWLTISSFLTWISFLDFGLGHGLRNKLTESFTIENKLKSKQLISTAYLTIGVVMGLFILFSIILSFTFNWSMLLKTNAVLEKSLPIYITLTLIGFALQLFFRTIFAVLYSKHSPGKVEVLNSVIQVIILVSIYIISFLALKSTNLLLLIIVFNFTPSIVLLIYSIYFFLKTPELLPKFEYFQHSEIKSIFGLGVKFLVLQIGSFILISSHQFIIGNFFSQEQVVDFTISQRYYSIIFIIWGIFINPLWSLVTESYVKLDYLWIENSLKRISIQFMGISLVSFVLYLIAPLVYKLWIGENFKQNKILDISNLVFYLIICFNATIGVYLNALSIMKVQLQITFIVSSLAILTYLFFKKYNLLEIHYVPVISSIFLLIAGIYFLFYLKNFIKNNKH